MGKFYLNNFFRKNFFQKNIFLSGIFLFIAAGKFSFAEQTVRGKIFDENNRPVAGANILAPDYKRGARSRSGGIFEIKNLPQNIDSLRLKFSFIGYSAIDTVIRLPLREEIFIRMRESAAMTEEVAVTGTREISYIKDLPVKVEVITNKDLQKIYSTDFTQALQFTPGVRVQNNCGVCGTNDIRIQGMEGQYTQMLINGSPIMSNLSTVYGLMGITASSIQQIEIVKGPGTILFGPEAVAGKINIILKNPCELPEFAVNSTARTCGDHQISLTGTKQWENLSSSLTADYSGNYSRKDENRDGFTDIPLFQRLALTNQWDASLESGVKFNLLGKYYFEDRFGGQTGWQKNLHRGSDKIYGESIITHRQEFLGSVEKNFSGNFRLQSHVSQTYHDQDSYYGTTYFAANQFISYADILGIFSSSPLSTWTAGIAYRFERYDDNTPVTRNFSDTTKNSPAYYHIPSLFVQNEWRMTDALTSLVGLRYNYHNQQKSIWQPRAALKWQMAENSTLRFSFGTGFRTVNIFTEDHAALTGSREVVITERLRPEQSTSYSINFIQDFLYSDQFARFGIDLHYTHFSNQINADYDSDPNKIFYRNISDGFAVSRGVETSFEYQFAFPLRAKISYEFLETFQEEKNIRRQILFNPKHRLNWQLDYQFAEPGISLNLTGQYVGVMQLPRFEGEFSRPDKSQPYTLWNIQAGKMFDGFELTVGVQNIFDWRQPSPLINPQNPFSDTFDTSYVYGPLEGREGYIAFRWLVN